MPCYHTGSREGDLEEALQENSKEAALLENMLCGLCTRLWGAGLAGYITTDQVLAKWWRTHQKRDRAEKAAQAADKTREELAKKAMAKLSKAEREALGIR